jgi:hypothetical protein
MEGQLILILSLPLVFISHDFEEIIGIEPWAKKNADYRGARFSKLAPRVISHFLAASTRQLAIGVLVMFLLICSATYLSVFTEFYQIWMGAFVAYSIHIIVHIIQWIIFGRYVPAIITSLLSVPYCIYGIFIIINTFSISDIIVWSLLMSVIAIVLLLIVHQKIIK